MAGDQNRHCSYRRGYYGSSKLGCRHQQVVASYCYNPAARQRALAVHSLNEVALSSTMYFGFVLVVIGN